MSLWKRLFGSGPSPLDIETYGGFVPVEKVATGRMSVLYRGTHAETGEVAAVKVLSGYGNRVAEKLTRKLKMDWEGTRAQKLEHRNVVRTIGCGKEHGNYYILMEFLPGGNLTGLLRAKSKSIEGRKLQIMQQAGRGLEYIHSVGVIHRDICPRNFMLSAYGVAKLIDFGVAANRDDKIRNTGQRTGRPAYMAPELIRTNHFSEQTDLYAFGVSLYEVATGQRPFQVPDDVRKALSALLNMAAPKPRELRPSVSERLERIILRAIQPDTRNRYPGMGALLEDLDQCDDGDL